MATIYYLRTSTGYQLAARDEGVQPLAVRIDTPAGVGTLAESALICTIEPGNEAENFFEFSSDVGFVLDEPIASGQPLPEGSSYAVRLQNGAWGTVAQFNQALQSLSSAARAQGFRHAVRIILPENGSVPADATLSFKQTYYG